MNECNAFIGPTGPIGAPLCVDLPIPVCTYRQYMLETATIQRGNAQYSNGPLGMEEHLAADQGCKVGTLTMVRPPVPWQSSTMTYSILTLGVLALLLVYVLQSVNANNQGAHNGKGSQ